ncbi:MAG: metal-dependent hydrolase, partial [Verrucomicrobiaceae bacterium]
HKLSLHWAGLQPWGIFLRRKPRPIDLGCYRTGGWPSRVSCTHEFSLEDFHEKCSRPLGPACNGDRRRDASSTVWGETLQPLSPLERAHQKVKCANGVSLLSFIPGTGPLDTGIFFHGTVSSPSPTLSAAGVFPRGHAAEGHGTCEAAVDLPLYLRWTGFPGSGISGSSFLFHADDAYPSGESRFQWRQRSTEGVHRNHALALCVHGFGLYRSDGAQHSFRHLSKEAEEPDVLARAGGIQLRANALWDRAGSLLVHRAFEAERAAVVRGAVGLTGERMDTVTHAFAPVILTRVVLGRPGWMPKRGLLAIGLAGALPDLLNPHLSLASRMTSWSHGLPFWGGLTVVLLGIAMVKRKILPVRLAVLLSAAYLFHMVCDAISGGINWLYPLKTFVWGDYFVDPVWWIPLDVVCVLTAYWMFRVLPLRAKVREAREQQSGT